MARPAVDITGQVFGDWTVLRRDGQLQANAAWLCRCPAGHERRINSQRLRDGRTLRCPECGSRKVTASYRRDEEFVRTWQAAYCVADVADVMGLTVVQTQAIAARLRRHGVEIKRMARTKASEKHYDSLRSLAAELTPEEE